MRLYPALFYAVSFVTTLNVQHAFCGAQTNSSPNAWAVAYSTGMAEVSRKALVALHENKTNDAIQFLEGNLDQAIVMLDSRLDKETNYRVVIESALKAIASYRTIHKRPDIMLYGSEEDKRIMNDAAQRAQRILERYLSEGTQTTNKEQRAVSRQPTTAVPTAPTNAAPPK